MPSWCKLLKQAAARLDSLARPKAGKSSAANTLMTAMTTRSSMRVKAYGRSAGALARVFMERPLLLLRTARNDELQGQAGRAVHCPPPGNEYGAHGSARPTFRFMKNLSGKLRGLIVHGMVCHSP